MEQFRRFGEAQNPGPFLWAVGSERWLQLSSYALGAGLGTTRAALSRSPPLTPRHYELLAALYHDKGISRHFERGFCLDHMGGVLLVAARRRRALHVWTGGSVCVFDRHESHSGAAIHLFFVSCFRRRVGGRPGIWIPGLFAAPACELWETKRLGANRPREIRSVNVGGSRGVFESALGWAGPVLMIQEHRCDAAGLGGWAALARKAGWSGVWAPAAAGPRGGASGGLAILARTPLLLLGRGQGERWLAGRIRWSRSAD